MLHFYRPNANFSLKRKPYLTNKLIVCRDFNIKNLFWWILLEMRELYHDSFLFEKELKKDIFAVRL